MQFYAIVPIIIVVSRALRSHSTKLLLLIFTVSKYLHLYRPDKSETFNLQTRAWEFLVGMIVHDLGSHKYKEAIHKRTRLDVAAEETNTMFDNVPLLEKEDGTSESSEVGSFR